MNITGTAGSDYLMGEFGDDLIEGLGGSDVLEASDGFDTLRGGAGNDILRVIYGDGALFDGGEGQDTLGGGIYDVGTNVTMIGGTGADEFRLSDGVRVEDFGAGDSLILQSSSIGIYVIEDQISRTDSGGVSVFEVDPLAFRYFPFGMLDGGLTFTIVGAPANLTAVPMGESADGMMGVSTTTLTADPGPGFVRGGGEEGVVALANAGGQQINGTVGFSNLLTGQAGADTLSGGAWSDTLSGGGGRDLLLGGDGEDVLGGGADADTIQGGGGEDLLYGSGGSDVLFGGDGDDILYGDGAV
ncbi:calcium-binding protein [Parvularcula dongshanensis]|uniref:Ca2+-binding RTX toxin-like protein n=1 Tax=Parvularcula dongshanensis TaxID=1173995 RepID=A0A840I0P7_9PROT|nr:calcium-binding protein [Parvularcula dongshanensis]MBB4658636.1 Ca2+-binding RTX toxin-like protein [Parvularcula dongshanensis]